MISQTPYIIHAAPMDPSPLGFLSHVVAAAKNPVAANDLNYSIYCHTKVSTDHDCGTYLPVLAERTQIGLFEGGYSHRPGAA